MTLHQDTQKKNQITLIRKLISLEGSLLTEPQRRTIISLTTEHDIIKGLNAIAEFKQLNGLSCNVPPALPKY